MRVLLAHNHYHSWPSGEDVVFRNERQLLEDRGVEVVPFERFNADIADAGLGKRVAIALGVAWSKRTCEELSDTIRRTRPDIAHFHNTFPLISPSAYAACQDNAVPVVQTLHNYRLICAGALLMRDDRPCEDCVGTTMMPALRHRCYKGSLPATGAVVWMTASNRWWGSYKTLVNRYIALSRFAAGRFIAGGVPENRIEVKPNFLPKVPAAYKGGGNYAVYVGRLSEEKGVRTLIAAWRQVDKFSLKVLGDGPLRRELEAEAKRQCLAIEFLGFRPIETVLETVGNADLEIIPSKCYENFPMAVLEAYGCGTPVVASRIGSLNEIVLEDETGVKFEPGNPQDLARAVNALGEDRGKLNMMRQRARSIFEQKYTADKNYSELIEIYNRATDDFAKNTRRKG